MFDSNLMFMTTGDLTESMSLGPLTIYGTPIHGMAVRISVPTGYLNDTIAAKLYASTNGTNYNVLAAHAKGAVNTIGGVDIMVPFALPKGLKTYLKLELSVLIASTTAVFGAVKAGIVLGGGASIDRSVDWNL